PGAHTTCQWLRSCNRFVHAATSATASRSSSVPESSRAFVQGQADARHDPGVHRFPCLGPSSPLCFLFVARSCKSERERRRVRRKGAALRLPAAEVALFYKLYHAVLLYSNQRLGLARQV